MRMAHTLEQPYISNLLETVARWSGCPTCTFMPLWCVGYVETVEILLRRKHYRVSLLRFFNTRHIKLALVTLDCVKTVADAFLCLLVTLTLQQLMESAMIWEWHTSFGSYPYQLYTRFLTTECFKWIGNPLRAVMLYQKYTVPLTTATLTSHVAGHGVPSGGAARKRRQEKIRGRPSARRRAMGRKGEPRRSDPSAGVTSPRCVGTNIPLAIVFIRDRPWGVMYL